MIFVSVIGIVFIFLFMFVFYCLLGFVVVIMLGLYIFVILFVFNWMYVVFMLLGIVVLVFGVGIVVDVNIIMYERLKEELKIGKLMMLVFCVGNYCLLVIILDVNVMIFVVVGVLFVYGNSFVKGFVISLIVSILVGFIMNVFGICFLLGLFVKSCYFDKKLGYFGVK